MLTALCKRSDFPRAYYSTGAFVQMTRRWFRWKMEHKVLRQHVQFMPAQAHTVIKATKI